LNGVLTEPSTSDARTPDWQTTESLITVWNGKGFATPLPNEEVERWKKWRADVRIVGGSPGPDGRLIFFDVATRNHRADAGPQIFGSPSNKEKLGQNRSRSVEASIPMDMMSFRFSHLMGATCFSCVILPSSTAFL
jgi:hypothetical protein